MARAERQSAVRTVPNETQSGLRALRLGDRVLGMLAALLGAAAAETHGDFGGEEGLVEQVVVEQGAVPGPAGAGETQMRGERERELVLETDRLEDLGLPAAAAAAAAAVARG